VGPNPVSSSPGHGTFPVLVLSGLGKPPFLHERPVRLRAVNNNNGYGLSGGFVFSYVGLSSLGFLKGRTVASRFSPRSEMLRIKF